jgi:hypothetical protein
MGQQIDCCGILSVAIRRDGHHPARPAGTPVAEGRALLEGRGYSLVVGINTTQNRGELWRRGNEVTQFIPYIGQDAAFFMTERLNEVLSIPYAR